MLGDTCSTYLSLDWLCICESDLNYNVFLLLYLSSNYLPYFSRAVCCLLFPQWVLLLLLGTGVLLMYVLYFCNTFKYCCFCTTAEMLLSLCWTTYILLLYLCCTIAKLHLYLCCTYTLLPFYLWFTTAILRLYLCYSIAILQFHLFSTNAIVMLFL